MESDWNTPHFGQGLDPDRADYLMYHLWSDRARKSELDLFARKHWDYRHLSPAEATYLFARLFRHLEKRIKAEYLCDDGGDSSIVARDIMEEPKNQKARMAWRCKLTALIKGRQFADKFGIPYSFCIERGLQHWFFGRAYVLEKKASLPLLLNNEECQIAVAQAWLDNLGARIDHATHPRYLLENGCTHPDIQDHQDWLLEQIAKKANPVPSLGKFMSMGLLSRPNAVARFGQSRVDRALA